MKKTFNIACVAGGILVTKGYRVSREASCEASGEAERENVSTVLATPPPKLRLLSTERYELYCVREKLAIFFICLFSRCSFMTSWQRF